MTAPKEPTRNAAPICEWWELVHPTTWRVVTAYDSREEADAAARWYAETYGLRLIVQPQEADRA